MLGSPTAAPTMSSSSSNTALADHLGTLTNDGLPAGLVFTDMKPRTFSLLSHGILEGGHVAGMLVALLLHTSLSKQQSLRSKLVLAETRL